MPSQWERFKQSNNGNSDWLQLDSLGASPIDRGSPAHFRNTSLLLNPNLLLICFPSHYLLWAYEKMPAKLLMIVMERSPQRRG